MIFVLDFSFTLALTGGALLTGMGCDRGQALLGATSAFGTCVER